MPAVFYRAPLILNIFESGAEWYAKKIVELLHCEIFGIEAIPFELESVSSCSKLV